MCLRMPNFTSVWARCGLDLREVISGINIFVKTSPHPLK
jgi:hypothetical protein